MSCQALKANLKCCRNWSCLDSKYCSQHENLSQETRKDRWICRYILGGGGVSPYSWWHKDLGIQILTDLKSKRIVLTKTDISKIPSRDRYIDIYVFLIKHGYADASDNSKLLARSYLYYIQGSSQNRESFDFLPEICSILILQSGRSLFRFLKTLSVICKKYNHFTPFAIEEIPRYLDSEAAKELSWWSHKELDELRIHYEKELSVEHPLTRCLVLRWLLDLKELYRTEKAIQKIKMDQCKEELMMNRWHPDRLWKYYEMFGIEVDDM